MYMVANIGIDVRLLQLVYRIDVEMDETNTCIKGKASRVKGQVCIQGGSVLRVQRSSTTAQCLGQSPGELELELRTCCSSSPIYTWASVVG